MQKKFKCENTKGWGENNATGTLYKAGGGCKLIQPSLKSWAYPFTQPFDSCIHPLEKVSHVCKGDVYKNVRSTMCKTQMPTHRQANG